MYYSRDKGDKYNLLLLGRTLLGKYGASDKAKEIKYFSMSMYGAEGAHALKNLLSLNPEENVPHDTFENWIYSEHIEIEEADYIRDNEQNVDKYYAMEIFYNFFNDYLKGRRRIEYDW